MIKLFCLLFFLISINLNASQIDLKIEIPELDVAEYHRPYVAIWLENKDRSILKNLAVWYDVKMKNKEGETWLKDLRQWWRRSGRKLKMPVDGVSGATKRVGFHELKYNSKTTQLIDLPAGLYTLYIEASREVGGREMLSQEIKWNSSQNTQEYTLNGKTELGKIVIKVKNEK